MPSTQLVFGSRDEHRAWLAAQAELPRGFRIGRASLSFLPREAPKPARMNLTAIVLDEATPAFAAVFTRNALVGAPVIVGRQRLEQPALRALIVNNKVSNVGAPSGVEAAETVCAALAQRLGCAPGAVLPVSTGVIGWSLPVPEMLATLDGLVASLGGGSALPAAEGITTTDLYPKVRSRLLGSGRIVGLAKGAGMIEPHLATMLGFVLTDLAVPRKDLRAALAAAVARTFNAISIDGDTSTSDTVVLVSSGQVAAPPLDQFQSALEAVCADLAEDVVRNGEGVRHVLRVRVLGAPDEAAARDLARTVVNAPLLKCAVAGNDPNVGRLLQAVGKHAARHSGALAVDFSRLRAAIGGIEVFADGAFRLDPSKEAALAAHFRSAELYASVPTADGYFRPPVSWPPHERSVEIEIDLRSGDAEGTVLGADLTHEYVSENADYRS